MAEWLLQVVATAFQPYAGTDLFPSPLERAAALRRGITQGHPFTDGNKRTGFLIAAYYLEGAGFELPAELAVDDVVSMCVRVSSGEIRNLTDVRDALARLWGIRHFDSFTPAPAR